jgi:hypothetical protein
MSYDLMVFEPSAAPREREQFESWYRTQTEWAEPHGYDNPSVTSSALRKWYEAITQTYPNMNSPELGDEDFTTSSPSDYSIGTNVIYAAFAWTEADNAYALMRQLAVEHGVGFYDVSDDQGNQEIYFPGDQLREPSNGQWRQVAADFRSGDVSKYIPQDFAQDEPRKRRWFDFFRRK